jgi:hypothetical protein
MWFEEGGNHELNGGIVNVFFFVAILLAVG